MWKRQSFQHRSSEMYFGFILIYSLAVSVLKLITEKYGKLEWFLAWLPHWLLNQQIWAFTTELGYIAVSDKDFWAYATLDPSLVVSANTPSIPASDNGMITGKSCGFSKLSTWVKPKSPTRYGDGSKRAIFRGINIQHHPAISAILGYHPRLALTRSYRKSRDPIVAFFRDLWWSAPPMQVYIEHLYSYWKLPIPVMNDLLSGNLT